MEQSKVRVKIRVGEVEIEAEGDRKFVNSKIKQLKKEWFGAEVGKKLKRGEPGRITVPVASFSEFYAEKKPQTHGERIAVFAYHLEINEGGNEFSHSDILKAYEQARIPKPKNIHDIMSKTYKRLGYILPGSKKGLWRLSRAGKERVEKLPRGDENNED